MAGATRPQDRPIAPHLSVWRWHITMASSILHRATGVALYGGAVLLTIWIIATAAGPLDYEPVGDILSTWYGQIAIYGLVGCLAYHLANGIRHLVFDTGAGLKPGDADATAWFAVLFGIVAPIGLWALLKYGV